MLFANLFQKLPNRPPGPPAGMKRVGVGTFCTESVALLFVVGLAISFSLCLFKISLILSYALFIKEPLRD